MSSGSIPGQFLNLDIPEGNSSVIALQKDRTGLIGQQGTAPRSLRPIAVPIEELKRLPCLSQGQINVAI